MMGYFRECPDCGAHLDPGERCNCNEEEDDKCRKENAITVSTFSEVIFADTIHATVRFTAHSIATNTSGIPM